MAMKIKVRAFGDLMVLLGSESTVELDANARLKDLFYKIAERVGSPRNFLGHYDLNDSELVILLNGRNIHSLEMFESSLKDGDVVVLLPPFVGG